MDITKAEKLLEKFARKNMIEWNQESFKRTHSKLHKSIIEAINEALTIPAVVGRSEQLANFCKKISKQEDCPAEFQEIVNKEFWNLIG